MSPPRGSPVDTPGESRRYVSRRRLLLTLGTGSTAALAGCASPLSGNEPRSLNPPEVIQDGPLELVWNFPREGETVVQTYLQQAYRLPVDAQTSGMRFQFGASVFGHSDYHHDQFTVRLHAPATPDSTRPSANIFVEPPGAWETFRAYRATPDTVVALTDLETVGTIHFDFLVEPATATPMPETLRCEFEVTAAKSGLLSERAVASDSSQFDIVREDG